MTCTPFLKCVLIALLFSSSTATGQTTECCDPKGPFVLGEAFPEIPATCTSLPDWIDRAPDINARISFSIVGVLEEVHEEEGLAYLLMCQPDQVRVLCVTYSTNDLNPGDEVMLAGGYSRVGDAQVMLDPCLPYAAQ